MSPLRPPHSHRTAIIGAGAGGLAAARAFTGEQCFDAVDVYEQRSNVGGVWNYTSTTTEDITPVPSTDPNAPQELQLSAVSAVYDHLETNIPSSLMIYPDCPFPEHLPAFPPHSAVLEYIRDYAKDLRHLITFKTRVTKVHKPPGSSQWHLETSTSPSPALYDFIVVASGHYNLPYIPTFPGLGSFPRSSIHHSKNFRRASYFANKRVLVVGNSASGYDIAMQLAPVVHGPLLQSIRTPTGVSDPSISVRPELVALDPDTRGAIFADGSREDGIEEIVFCTGYLFSMPFLDLPVPAITDGSRVRGLWKHIFYRHDPTLSFIGLPIKIVPFPLSHNQALVIVGVYTGRIKLPADDVMREWEEEELQRKGGNERTFHFYGYPQDADYMDELADMCGEGGMKWDAKMRWVRSKVKVIKEADIELKKRGMVAKTVEEILVE